MSDSWPCKSRSDDLVRPRVEEDDGRSRLRSRRRATDRRGCRLKRAPSEENSRLPAGDVVNTQLVPLLRRWWLQLFGFHQN